MKYLFYLLTVGLLIVGCNKKQLYKQPPEEQKKQQIKARDHFTNGMFHQLDNQHENALIEFYQALLYDSTSSIIYNRIAENHMALGRYESAIRYLEKSLNLDGKNIETIRLIADCYYRLKNDSTAISYLTKVLELDPLDENARSLLLLLYRKTSNNLGIAQIYEQMINIYGEDESWVRKAATIYLQNGQLEDAAGLYTSFLNKDSTNAAMWFSLGSTFEMQGKSTEALSAYQKALTLSPEFDEAADRIHRLCRRDGNWKSLIDIIEPLFNRGIKNNIYNWALAEAYLSTEELEKAKSYLLPLLDDPEPDWKTYELLGRIEMEADNYNDAENYFQKIIELDRQNRIGWIYLGFVYSDMDSLDRAEKNYRHALKFLPDDPFLLSFHGITLIRLERDEDALQPLEKALVVDPDNLNTLISYGLTLNRLKRNQKAMESFEKALKLDNKNTTVLTSLGMIYDDLKMYDKCDSLYDQALIHHPENHLLMNNYSYSLADRGERIEYALKLAKKAIAADPENGAYLDTIGWVYYRLGRYQTALNYIKKSLQHRENSAVVIEHLGDVYLKLGQAEEAKIQWKRHLKLTQIMNDSK